MVWYCKWGNVFVLRFGRFLASLAMEFPRIIDHLSIILFPKVGFLPRARPLSTTHNRKSNQIVMDANFAMRPTSPSSSFEVLGTNLKHAKKDKTSSNKTAILALLHGIRTVQV